MGHVWHVPPETPHVVDEPPGWHMFPIGSQQVPLQGEDATLPQFGEHWPAVHAFPASQSF
jgi:hypothetical protein